MKQHVRRAVAFSASATLVTALGWGLFLGGLGPNGAEVLGRIFAVAACAGLLCGWLAGRAGQSWSLFKFSGAYAACFAAALFVSARGYTPPMASATGQPEFSVTWPQGWTVQHLDGVSSAESDRSLGWRERGILGPATAPKGVIEVACGTKRNHAITNADALADVLAATAKGYRAQGFEVSATTPTPQRMGAYEGMAAQVSAAHDDRRLQQSIAITQND